MPKSPFEELLDAYAGIVRGLETGLVKAMAFTPLALRQEFQSQVKRKLNSSADEYLSALSIDLKDGIVIVELDSKNWLANAVEDGVTTFDLHNMLNTSQKARITKAGFRTLTIPMEKTKSKTSTPSTLLGQQLDQKIRDALNGKPRWTIPYTSQQSDGTVTQMESLVTKDPDLVGLSRVRRFQQPEDVPMGRRPLSSQFVLFRKMSTNPLSKSFGRWRHPGIQSRGLFKDVQAWADTTLPVLLEKIIQDSVQKELKK